MSPVFYETYYGDVYSYSNALYHHGIKGQKWGIRRFQNPDGSLTALGRLRYGTKENFDRIQEDRQRRREIKSERRVAAKQRRAEKKEIRAEKEKQKFNKKIDKAVASGDLKTIQKHAERVSTNQLREAQDRARILSQMSESTKHKPVITLRSVTDYGNRVVDFLTMTKKLKEALTPKEKKKEESDGDKAYRENALKAAKAAADKARGTTEGNNEDKERAAKKAFYEVERASKLKIRDNDTINDAARDSANPNHRGASERRRLAEREARERERSETRERENAEREARERERSETRERENAEERRRRNEEATRRNQRIMSDEGRAEHRRQVDEFTSDYMRGANRIGASERRKAAEREAQAREEEYRRIQETRTRDIPSSDRITASRQTRETPVRDVNERLRQAQQRLADMNRRTDTNTRSIDDLTERLLEQNQRRLGQ